MTVPFSVAFGSGTLLLYEPHAIDAKPLTRSLRGVELAVASGARTIETVSELPTGVHQIDWVCENRADCRQLEDFFDSVQGAFGGFWMPTWQWEFEVAPFTDTPTHNAVWVRPAHYGPGAFAKGAPFRYLGFLRGDKYETYLITAVTQDSPPASGYERLDKSARASSSGGMGISEPYTEDKGVRPLWLRYVRFVDDEIEAQELGDDSALYSLHVIELPRESPTV